MSNIIQFHGIRSPIGHGIRTGESSYRQISNLHAEGRLPVKIVVIDASRASRQKEFISILRSEGTEVILDTKCAELSALEKFSGYAQGTPWAQKERPLIFNDLTLALTPVFMPKSHDSRSRYLKIDQNPLFNELKEWRKSYECKGYETPKASGHFHSRAATIWWLKCN